MSGATLSPSFTAATTDYSMTVANAVRQVTITVDEEPVDGFDRVSSRLRRYTDGYADIHDRRPPGQLSATTATSSR